MVVPFLLMSNPMNDKNKAIHLDKIIKIVNNIPNDYLLGLKIRTFINNLLKKEKKP